MNKNIICCLCFMVVNVLSFDVVVAAEPLDELFNAPKVINGVVPIKSDKLAYFQYKCYQPKSEDKRNIVKSEPWYRLVLSYKKKGVYGNDFGVGFGQFKQLNKELLEEAPESEAEVVKSTEKLPARLYGDLNNLCLEYHKWAEDRDKSRSPDRSPSISIKFTLPDEYQYISSVAKCRGTDKVLSNHDKCQKAFNNQKKPKQQDKPITNTIATNKQDDTEEVTITGSIAISSEDIAKIEKSVSLYDQTTKELKLIANDLTNPEGQFAQNIKNLGVNVEALKQSINKLNPEQLDEQTLIHAVSQLKEITDKLKGKVETNEGESLATKLEQWELDLYPWWLVIIVMLAFSLLLTFLLLKFLNTKVHHVSEGISDTELIKRFSGEFKKQREDLEKQHRSNIDSMEKGHSTKIASTESEHSTKIAAIEKDYNNRINDINQQKDTLERQINSFRELLGIDEKLKTDTLVNYVKPDNNPSVIQLKFNLADVNKLSNNAELLSYSSVTEAIPYLPENHNKLKVKQSLVINVSELVEQNRLDEFIAVLLDTFTRKSAAINKWDDETTLSKIKQLFDCENESNNSFYNQLKNDTNVTNNITKLTKFLDIAPSKHEKLEQLLEDNAALQKRVNEQKLASGGSLIKQYSDTLKQIDSKLIKHLNPENRSTPLNAQGNELNVNDIVGNLDNFIDQYRDIKLTIDRVEQRILGKNCKDGYQQFEQKLANFHKLKDLVGFVKKQLDVHNVTDIEQLQLAFEKEFAVIEADKEELISLQSQYETIVAPINEHFEVTSLADDERQEPDKLLEQLINLAKDNLSAGSTLTSIVNWLDNDETIKIGKITNDNLKNNLQILVRESAAVSQKQSALLAYCETSISTLRDVLRQSDILIDCKLNDLDSALGSISAYDDFTENTTLDYWQDCLAIVAPYCIHQPASYVLGSLEQPVKTFYYAAITMLAYHEVYLNLPYTNELMPNINNFMERKELTEMLKQFSLGNDASMQDLEKYYFRQTALNLVLLEHMQANKDKQDVMSQLRGLTNLAELRSFIRKYLTDAKPIIVYQKHLSLITANNEIGKTQYDQV